MEKVVKTAVTELLSKEAKRSELIIERQFGCKQRRSAIDAPAIIVDRTNAAWKNGHITGMLCIEIKAAFPSLLARRKTS